MRSGRSVLFVLGIVSPSSAKVLERFQGPPV